jgi:hypothetical protein
MILTAPENTSGRKLQEFEKSLLDFYDEVPIRDKYEEYLARAKGLHRKGLLIPNPKQDHEDWFDFRHGIDSVVGRHCEMLGHIFLEQLGYTPIYNSSYQSQVVLGIDFDITRDTWEQWYTVSVKKMIVDDNDDVIIRQDWFPVTQTPDRILLADPQKHLIVFDRYSNFARRYDKDQVVNIAELKITKLKPKENNNDHKPDLRH